MSVQTMEWISGLITLDSVETYSEAKASLKTDTGIHFLLRKHKRKKIREWYEPLDCSDRFEIKGRRRKDDVTYKGRGDHTTIEAIERSALAVLPLDPTNSKLGQSKRNMAEEQGKIDAHSARVIETLMIATCSLRSLLPKHGKHQ